MMLFSYETTKNTGERFYDNKIDLEIFHRIIIYWIFQVQLRTWKIVQFHQLKLITNKRRNNWTIQTMSYA